MDVAVIPTNGPCIRLDHPERIFRDREAKQRALVSEIRRINKTGRPVLIGTGSVEESERLAADLEAAEINCRVLNARNDEMEARIIARAGEPGAVTVSTNMAGRGVDIKLGGEKEQHREKVAALGGLYVIGTGLNESRRIDNQLKGRAGRQGDPGESRIFISLEDELIQKYGIARLPAVRKVFEKSTGEIDAPDARKAILSAQKIIEGYNSDLRLQLAKYSYLIEQQRRIIHDKRQNILTDRVVPKLLSEKAPEKYSLICSLYGDAVAVKVEKQLILYYINKCWADYLDYISYVREGIHLVSIAKKEPLHEYNKIAVEAFEEMLENIESGMIETFNAAEITEAGMDMGKEGLEVPSSTWTYLINDSPEQFSNLQHLLKAASNYINKPLFTLRSIYKKLHRQ